jgi:predicted AlkP superfamily phosphohydrolase/phosphomutase
MDDQNSYAHRQLLNTQQKRKVLVIGLDGATFDLMEPWVADGKLPAIARLMEEGSHGVLRSVVPPFTAPAWSSFLTGKHPGHHGLLFFLNRKKGSYELEPANSTHIQGEGLGAILTGYGRSVGLMNVPCTYPPQPVEGFIVAGLGTPSQASCFTYPESLKDELVRRFNYEFERSVKYRRGHEKAFIDIVTDVEERRYRATKYLMEKHEWDLFAVVFRGTDILGHSLWRFMDPAHPRHEPHLADVYGNGLLRHYQRMDEIIGELWTDLHEDTILIVMSDHGMGPLHRYVHLDSLLRRLGLLKIKPGPINNLKDILFRIGLSPRNLLNFMIRTGVRDALRKVIPQPLAWQMGMKVIPLDIDWASTRAYPLPGTGFICLNVAGRDPFGVVARGSEYNRLVEFITKSLLDLRDPDTGEPLVSEVIRREEIYSGDEIDTTPDLWVVWRDDRYAEMSGGSPRVFSELVREPSGTHTMRGIFLACGRGIKAGYRIGNAEIIDMAPSILHVMGEAVPRDTDGRVLREIFQPGSELDRAVMYQESETGNKDTMSFTEEESQAIQERLRNLGYI